MTTLRLNKNLHVIPQFSCNVKKLLLSLFVVVCFVNGTNTHAITVTTSAAPIIASQLSNISTRGFVQTGDNVMIAGFIIQGTQPKRIIMRAIGPELTRYGVPNALADPTLELRLSRVRSRAGFTVVEHFCGAPALTESSDLKSLDRKRRLIPA